MSAGQERCPVCGPAEVLTERTNGMGGVFLECPGCRYTEFVVRRADPHPSRTTTHVHCGVRRKRYKAPALRPKRGPYHMVIR